MKLKSPKGKIQKIIVAGMLIIILLSISVNSRSGGAFSCDMSKYKIWFYKARLSNEDANIYALKERYGFMIGCFERGYNFGKVTYHDKAIGGTHWY